MEKITYNKYYQLVSTLNASVKDAQANRTYSDSYLEWEELEALEMACKALFELVEK